VTATPTATATQTATSTATATATATPTATPTAVPDVLKVKPLSKNFGKVKVDALKPATLTLTNSAKTGAPITFGKPMVTFTAASPQEFKMNTTTCGTQLLPQQACKVTVQFGPLSPGKKTTTITIFDNAKNADQTIPLSGTGK
jgi:hypothetical protein